MPSNWLGYQAAAGGSGYAGLVTFNGDVPFYRELIEAELTNSLEIGVPVQLSMQVALGGFGSDHDYSTKWTAKGIGLRLSTQPISWPPSVYPNAAHLFLDEVLTDTVGWHELSTSYIPDSAYSYITVGNFFEDAMSSPSLLDSTGVIEAAYVFVDDVCVSLDPVFCGTHIGIVELDVFQPLVFPDPVAEELHVLLPSSSRAVTVSIKDIAGRMMGKYQMQPSTSDRTLGVSDLPEGVYVLHVTDGVHSFAPVRFVHVTP